MDTGPDSYNWFESCMLWRSCDGMMLIDENRRILAMNPALEKMTGVHAQEVIGKTQCGSVFSCRDRHGCAMANQPGQCPALKALQAGKPVQSTEYTIAPAGSKATSINASYTPIRLPDGRIRILGVMRNAGRQKRWEARLISNAMKDPLTGLPNRAAFMKACWMEIKRASRFHRPLSIALADLDGFKKYNDQNGHLPGDKLLRTVAELLQSGRRSCDLICRFGGDEFVLLFPETDMVSAKVVTERLRYEFAQFKTLAISMGVASFPTDGTTVDDLLARADERLYRAKRMGGNRVVTSMAFDSA